MTTDGSRGDDIVSSVTAASAPPKFLDVKARTAQITQAATTT
jgi:hypothetical protein